MNRRCWPYEKQPFMRGKPHSFCNQQPLLSQYRGENDELQPRNLEVITTTETEAIESTTLASHMRSLLPEAVHSSSRSSQQPRLSLYHTFNSNRMISRPSRTSFTGSSVGGGGGHNNNGGYEVTESRPPPASIQDEHVADSAVGSVDDAVSFPFT